MTMGAFRQQVGGMQTTLDGALASLGRGEVAVARAEYGQTATAYSGVAREISELYPLRCQRLLADRLDADAALLGAQVNPVAGGPAMGALRAGLVSLGGDLDQRIRQVSPNGLVGNQDEAAADAPSVTGTPTWDSQQTQDLATRTCAACHSNAPGWSWYANLAPLSWIVQHNVDDGRSAMNLSEWDQLHPRAAQAAATVQSGSMPPAWSGLIDSRLQLTDAERAELVRGLQSTLNAGGT
jgi:mono/diheme cytochrome c family protein